VLVNRNNDLLVEGDRMEIKDLKQAAMDFLDNGGAPQGGETKYCNYCKGARSASSSDNPDKAIISLTSDRLTDYDMYVAVQNELGAAYNELRNREAERLFGWKYTEKAASLTKISSEAQKQKIKDQLKQVRELFPFILTEAEAKQN
jgi:hypothetical protein